MPRFSVDTRRSTVDIGLRVNLHPSHITATGVRGTIECELDDHGRPDLERPYSAELTLPVDAISSGIGLQDREMRRRMGASRYPVITARVVHGEPGADGDGSFRATAKLTIHGQTREVTGEVRFSLSDSTVQADAQAVINIKDFGIDPPRLIVLRVEPDVDVRAHIVAEPQ
ncbi:MAG: YceI family protein [Candidatus Dormibacteria bacterium]